MKKKILVFIVTYKSSKKIKNIFDKISKIKDFKFYDIYISDDNSPDDTVNYLKKIKKKNVKITYNKKTLGYGGNIKKCLLFAMRNNYEEAVMIHGDDQYHVKYVPKLLNSLNDKRFSAVTGSRLQIKKNALKGKMPIYKFIGNIVLTFLFNFVFKTDFTDCHTGLWAYRISALKKIDFNKLDDGYNFDSQMRITLINKHLKIKEVPIQTFYRDEHSSYHIKYSSNFIKELFVYR